MMTVRRHRPPKRPDAGAQHGAYTLVMRTPDGRLHHERFDDAASYRARMTALEPSGPESVSIEDILGLLDV
jgi:hypothetical protein